MKSFRIMILVVSLAILVIQCDVVEVENDPNLTLELEKYNLYTSDSLKGILTVTNNSDETVFYEFSSGCQFGLEIKRNDKSLRNYPSVCPDVLTSLTLKENESKAYKFSLSLTDDNSNNLSKGGYKLISFLLNNNSGTITKTFNIL